MATQTTNLHLTKPDGSEKVNIGIINTNMDTIDTYAGTNNASIINLAEDIGVVVNGNKTKSGVTAAVGQYVILKNSTISNRADGLYTAAKAIPANTAIDASYLTAVSGGGLNALNANITTLGGKIAYETSNNVQDTDIVEAIKGFINNGSKGGTFLASRCTNTPNASLYYKIRYTKVDGSSWVMLEAWNTGDTSLYYINEMNPSTSVISAWKQYALKGENSFTVLVDERKTYDGTFSYVGASFTLTRPSIVIAYANYNNAPMKVLSILTSSTSSTAPYVVARSENTSMTNCFINAVLPAGTYYLWGQTSGNSGGNDTVVKAMAIAS